jgi:hypothetical protein
VAYAVFGLGFGFIDPPISTAAVSGMPASRAGVAAAIASMSRQVGATLGVAVLGSVVTARIVGPLSTGFVPAAHLGWLIMAGSGAALFVIGLVTTGRWAMRTAQVLDEQGFLRHRTGLGDGHCRQGASTEQSSPQRGLGESDSDL